MKKALTIEDFVEELEYFIDVDMEMTLSPETCKFLKALIEEKISVS